MQDIHAQRILILDFGSQYTQLIARRVREIGVYCEIRAYDMNEQAILDFAPNGIILAGGPESVTEVHSPRAPAVVFQMNVPVLGICYGMQTMAEQLGGKVSASDEREFGYANVQVETAGALLKDIHDDLQADTCSLNVWMSHGDKVTQMPEDFTCMASTASAPIAGMSNEAKRFYGLQFHPEVTHTLQGGAILERIVSDICGCEG